MATFVSPEPKFERPGRAQLTKIHAWLVALADEMSRRDGIRALQKLDDRMLADIGLERSEIESAVRWPRDRAG